MTEMVYGTHPVQAGEPVLPKWWRTVDRWTLTSVLLLMGVGLILGLAASPPLAERNGFEPFHYVKRQFAFTLISAVAMVGLSMTSPTTVRRLGVLGFLATFLALVMLPVFGTDFGKGAVRWYSLGFGSVQPSEFLKPCYIVATAWLMAAATEIGGPPGRLYSVIVTAVVAGFLVIQPDFGQATLLIFVWSAMYFAGGAPILVILSVVVALAGGGMLAYNTSEHFAGRIDGFLSPEVDPTTQIGYATNAIREGGFFGVGVGEGSVKWSLPDAHTDFIIAVAAEEYGLVAVGLVIFLFLVLVTRSLARLMRERDPFVRLAGTGIACLVGMQAIINMGVAVRLLPAKGMTLPFVSNGGSSVVAMGIAVGMLLALTRTRPQGDIADALFQRRATHD